MKKPRKYHLPPPKNATYRSGGIIELSADDDLINAGKPLPPVVELTPAGPPLLVVEARAEDDQLRRPRVASPLASDGFAKELEWCEKAAAQGLVEAQFTLGFLYQSGLGVPQDYVKARELFGKAAAQGRAIAIYNLARLYEQGLGGPLDLNRALELYRTAAAQGIVDAQDSLRRLGMSA